MAETLWPAMINNPTANCDVFIWGDMLVKQEKDPGWPLTDMGWQIVPWGFKKLLLWITKRYHPKGGIIVTENGCGMREATKAEAQRDVARIAYFRDYIGAMRDAIDEGADVRGYFVWTLLDN